LLPECGEGNIKESVGSQTELDLAKDLKQFFHNQTGSDGQMAAFCEYGNEPPSSIK
jgi:hypothetical protein